MSHRQLMEKALNILRPYMYVQANVDRFEKLLHANDDRLQKLSYTNPVLAAKKVKDLLLTERKRQTLTGKEKKYGSSNPTDSRR